MEHASHLCYRCGSVKLSPGSLVGRDLGFKPDDCRFWVAGTSRVSIRGNMCRECGALQLEATWKSSSAWTRPKQVDSRSIHPGLFMAVGCFMKHCLQPAGSRMLACLLAVVDEYGWPEPAD